jgi:hypothetical protein
MKDAPTKTGKLSPQDVGRLTAVLSLVAVFGLWLQHHLGFQFTNLGFVAGGIAGAGLVVKLVEKLVETRSLKTLVDPVLGWIRGLALEVSQARSLAVVSGLLVIVMGLITSVTVTPEQTGREPDTVSIRALGSSLASFQRPIHADSALVRFFPVFTNPFGRLFQVQAHGYLPATVSVYPLTAHNVVLGRDLAPAPSVLFRPFVEGTSALRDRGVFRVSRITANGLDVLSADTGSATSFRLGPPRPITASMVEFWRLQLEAFEAPSAERAGMLMLWNAPRPLKWVGVLSPGDSIRAEILRHGKPVARAEFTIGREPLVDVLVTDLLPDTTLAVTPIP